MIVFVLFRQRNRSLAHRRVSPHPAAGQQQMHLHHEDGAVGDALDRLPQPEIQRQQSHRFESRERFTMFLGEQVVWFIYNMKHLKSVVVKAETVHLSVACNTLDTGKWIWWLFCHHSDTSEPFLPIFCHWGIFFKSKKQEFLCSKEQTVNSYWNSSGTRTLRNKYIKKQANRA